MAKRSRIERIIGRGKRERSRRRNVLVAVASWTFVGIIAAFVILLLGQFITRTVITHPVSGEIDRPDLLVRKGERIQVNVLNGSGRSHIAQRFTDFLRARKFDVVQMDNYKDTNVEHSIIIDRVNDSISSHKIAYALGIDEKYIQCTIDTEEYVKADIVIGRDFLGLKPMK
ncbi:MAG TPA: LytR C-terminal domain-containing protein [Candidatus Kapabacteria bacterium]|nr:LytR C-terminal domain-containing protein [Candidatus Kapabacteria bacterium]